MAHNTILRKLRLSVFLFAMTIYALIPQDASTVHWAVSSAHYSTTAISRVCYATSAIALSIFNACSYLQQSMIHYSWQNMNDVGNSLLFSAAMVHHIFISFFRGNVFAPPEPVSSTPSSSLNRAFVSVEETAPLIENGETPRGNPTSSDVPNSPPLEATKVSLYPSTGELPPPSDKDTEISSEVIKPPAVITKAYASLLISDDEQKALRTLAKQLSDHIPNVFKIMRAGKKLENLHPLRFLGFLCGDEKIYADTDRTLKQALRIIRYGKEGAIRYDKDGKIEDGFYWGKFVGPLSASMQTHLDKHDIFPYLESFAKENHADFEKLSSYFDPLDCTGLVDYLLSL